MFQLALFGAAMIFSMALFSCKDTTNGSLVGPTNNPKLSGSTTEAISFEIQNNTVNVIDQIVITVAGAQQTLSVGASTTQSYTIQSTVTAMTIYGQTIAPGIATTVTLPSGTKVKVTWNGNIVVVDTLTIM